MFMLGVQCQQRPVTGLKREKRVVKVLASSHACSFSVGGAVPARS